MRLPKQFSLRAFGTFVLLLCIMLAYWISGVRRQQAATGTIRALEGRVRYAPPPTWIPEVFVKTLGEDYFCEVAGVTLYPTSESDADTQIVALKGLPNLKSLAIWPGVKGLGSIPGSVSGGITDEGVDDLLKMLPKLERLLITSARTSRATEKRLVDNKAFTRLYYDTTVEFGNRHVEHR
jgi:hypothetical protein